MVGLRDGYTVIGVDMHHPKPIYTIVTPTGAVKKVNHRTLECIRPLRNCEFMGNTGKLAWGHNRRPQGTSSIQYIVLGTYNKGEAYMLGSQSGDIHVISKEGYELLLSLNRVDDPIIIEDLGDTGNICEDFGYINLYEPAGKARTIVSPKDMDVSIAEHDRVLTRQLNDKLRDGLTSKLGSERVTFIETFVNAKLTERDEGKKRRNEWDSRIAIPGTLIRIPHINTNIEYNILASNIPDIELVIYWTIVSNHGAIREEQYKVNYNKEGLSADWIDSFEDLGADIAIGLLKQEQYSMDETNRTLCNSLEARK